MMPCFRLLAALSVPGVLLACRPPLKAVPPSGPNAAADLQAIVAAYDSAWAAKDTTAVGRLLSANYVYFTSKGGLSSRAETMRFLTDTSYVLTRVRRSDIQVTLSDPAARVTSRWEGEGRYQGEPVRDDQTCGQIWVWQEARWQLFSEHCVNRPLTDAAPDSTG
jgi:hypothetical protein